MDEAAAKNKTQAEIPFSIVEYTAVFKKPILEAWTVPALIIAAALNALEPYGFTLDGVEVKTHTEKLNEYAIVFRRRPANITLTLGLGKLTITAENLDWTEADQFIAAAKAGAGALVEKTKADVGFQNLALFIHIQIKTKPRQEITAPLLSPLALKLMDGELKFPGIILQRDKAMMVVDASVVYANALFVKITREHAANVAFEEMAKTLHTDEEQLFDALGLDGIL
jgi:hypothetical protein